MEPDRRDWPAARWLVTAPESYVLQLPRHLSSVEAFKLALRELVLRRALQVEQRERAGFLVRRRPKHVLRIGTRSESGSEPALAPLLDLAARMPERPELDGVPVEDFAKAARREFTRSLAGYVNECVYPALVDRGFMRPVESARWPGNRRRRYVRTEAGEDAAAELDEWLRVGRERVEDWARDEPERALAYAGGAGAAILLMPSLYPEFDKLGKQVVAGGDAALAHGWPGDLDLGSFDGDLGGFDGIDAGVDAGGGFGGGDGGGGGGDGGGG
jgi:hypothetical protein